MVPKRMLPRSPTALTLLSVCTCVAIWVLGVEACGSRTGLYLNEIGDASADGTVPDGAADGSEEADANLDAEGGVDAAPDVIPTGCGFQTCPDGCCASDGQCVLPQKDWNQACGGYGEPCEKCDVDAGFFCKGSCLRATDGPCSPSNCDGCCYGNDYCSTGRHDNSCGHGGEPCLRCNPAEGSGHCELLDGGGGVCSDAGPPCDPETCAGCCTTDGVCAVGTQPFACGSGGQDCTNCVFFGMQCVTGACQK